MRVPQQLIAVQQQRKQTLSASVACWQNQLQHA
jgi:hypothetical protein